MPTSTSGGSEIAPDDGAVEPESRIGADERLHQMGQSCRRPLVANWPTHPVLAKLFADWTALYLPPDWLAVGRWITVGVASGAYLASEDLAEAERFVASLDVDQRRSDLLYRALLDAFDGAGNQGSPAPIRMRAAVQTLVRSRVAVSPGGERLLWERGIGGLHSLAAGAIAWGVRAFCEGSLMAGILLAFLPRQHRMLQEFLVNRLTRLVRLGGRDDRALVLAILEDSYPNTPIQRATLAGAAKPILRGIEWMVCRSNISWWIQGAYGAGAELPRSKPEHATALIMELLRVIGPSTYEEQLRFSDDIAGFGRRNDGAIDANPGIYDLVRARWPWLLEGDTFGHECVLWWHVFDQAFWAGMLHECRDRELLPPKRIIDRFRRTET